MQGPAIMKAIKREKIKSFISQITPNIKIKPTVKIIVFEEISIFAYNI